MPDPMQILRAMAAAAAVAAAVLLLSGWPWRKPRPAAVSAGWVLGVGTGFFLGCWLLGFNPRWPPREDQDRWLTLLLPAVVGVELLAAWPALPRGLAWTFRLAIAAGAGRALLHNTTYLTDLAGPGSREWTPAQTGVILAGLAAALLAVWASLDGLARRVPGRSLPLALALACAGAAITVMLSGYSTGGQLGLALAAALAWATLVSLALAGPPGVTGAIGPGVVGLFALLVIGRFFGQLTTLNAVLLFFAPLLCWLPELPFVRRLQPGLRGFARLVLVAVPVAVALVFAQMTFVEDSRAPSGTTEPSSQDYMDFVPGN